MWKREREKIIVSDSEWFLKLISIVDGCQREKCADILLLLLLLSTCKMFDDVVLVKKEVHLVLLVELSATHDSMGSRKRQRHPSCL